MSQNQATLQGKFNIFSVTSVSIIPMLLCKFKFLQCWLSINHIWVVTLSGTLNLSPGEQISFAPSSPPQVTIHRRCGYQTLSGMAYYESVVLTVARQGRSSSLSEKSRESNCLQMELQWQHFLRGHLKTLNVDPARVRIHDLPQCSPWSPTRSQLSGPELRSF